MVIFTEKDIKENPFTRLNFYSPCMPEHCHTFLEIVLVESGSCINTINGNQILKLEEMEMIMIRTCDRHISKFGSVSSRWRDFYISEDDFKKTCNFLSNDVYEYFKQLDSIPRVKLTSEEYTIMQKKISYLEQTLLDKNQQDKARMIFLGIIIDILEIFLERNFVTNIEAPDWLSKLYKKMTYYDYVYKTIKDIVKETGFTNSYLTTMFKKFYGVTLIQFHNKMKVVYSVNLLGKQKIIDIALSLGWDNPKNYAIAFKRIYKVTPKKYEQLLMRKKK